MSGFVARSHCTDRLKVFGMRKLPLPVGRATNPFMGGAVYSRTSSWDHGGLGLVLGREQNQAPKILGTDRGLKKENGNRNYEIN